VADYTPVKFVGSGGRELSASEVLDYLESELEKLSETLNEMGEFLQLKQLHVEPEKPRAGMVVLADGTDWDPGSGAGFYGYYGAAWAKLG
jgi:hypothetical protein